MQSGLAIAILAVSLNAASAEPNAGVSLTMQERIVAARGAGDHAQVIALTDRVLEEDPQNTDALVLRGFARLSSGDLDAAEQDFRAAIGVAPNYLDAKLGLAYVSLRRGDAPTAERLAREVLEADEGYEDARALLARVQRQASAQRPKASRVPVAASRFDQTSAAESGTRRRTFSVDAGQAWGDREESELTLTFADSEWAGLRMVYGLRHTARPSGNATQVRLQGFQTYSSVTLGGELAIGMGADNLARLRIGASVLGALPNGLEFGAEARWESFASSRHFTVVPVATYRFCEERCSISFLLPTALTSETGGSATVIDARFRLPLGDRFQLGLGYAAGEEFDASTRREVRSASVALIADIEDRLRLSATLADGPYADTDQTRFNATVGWRF